MRAIRYEQFGGYEQAKLVDLPRPVPKDDEVLLAMRTIGCHPLDNTFRSAKHPAATAENLPRVAGQSGVGIVVETNSSLFSIGDRAIVSGGGFGRTVDGTWREFIAVAATALTPAPEGVDDNTAAAVGAGAGYLSGYLPLTAFVDFKPGQAVLAPGIGAAGTSRWLCACDRSLPRRIGGWRPADHARQGRRCGRGGCRGAGDGAGAPDPGLTG